MAQIRNTNIVEIQLTEKELTSIKTVSKMLKELYRDFSHHFDLQAVETGEIVSINEIPRVLGILSCFENYRGFEMKLRKEV